MENCQPYVEGKKIYFIFVVTTWSCKPVLVQGSQASCLHQRNESRLVSFHHLNVQNNPIQQENCQEYRPLFYYDLSHFQIIKLRDFKLEHRKSQRIIFESNIELRFKRLKIGFEHWNLSFCNTVIIKSNVSNLGDDADVNFWREKSCIWLEKVAHCYPSVTVKACLGCSEVLIWFQSFSPHSEGKDL